ncbi:hypothetical protein RvY_01296-3 [Ramazzottius varieornatus]|uniref:Uncharacterized protein n=1 Tax=Ramazzottius varieornatus TaxID=947166 RepID=A0A1D1UGP4_RAMVA|nr:hypothetical protein RvY_01296-3 [Ramazzottius varieornatus]
MKSLVRFNHWTFFASGCTRGYFRKVSNWIFLNNQPVQVHHRDVISKMHSLIYQLFTSPRFSNLISQAWHLSGYVDRSVEYVNPTEFFFARTGWSL